MSYRGAEPMDLGRDRAIERERARRDYEARRQRVEREERRASLIERGLLRLFANRPDWYAQAACKGNTQIMFDVHDPERAQAICAACEVREPCRELGRKGREQGTWGGETEVDRHHLGRGSATNVAARNKARTR